MTSPSSRELVWARRYRGPGEPAASPGCRRGKRQSRTPVCTGARRRQPRPRMPRRYGAACDAAILRSADGPVEAAPGLRSCRLGPVATMQDLDELALAMPQAEKQLSDDGRPTYSVHGKFFCFHRTRRPDAVDPET